MNDKPRLEENGTVLVIPTVVRIPLKYLNLSLVGHVMPKLTHAEQLVLSMIIDGKCNKEIAQEQGVSLSAVKKCVSNLLQKFAVDSRFELRDVAFGEKRRGKQCTSR